jgi:SnoaL-like polyketide cyclase
VAAPLFGRMHAGTHPDLERIRQGHRIRDRLVGFPDLTMSIQDMFDSGDKLAVTLMWRGTHTSPHGGVAATGRPVEVCDTAIGAGFHGVTALVTQGVGLEQRVCVAQRRREGWAKRPAAAASSFSSKSAVTPRQNKPQPASR